VCVSVSERERRSGPSHSGGSHCLHGGCALNFEIDLVGGRDGIL